MRITSSFLLLGALLVAGCTGLPTDTAGSDNPLVVLDTTEGEVLIELNRTAAPRTAANFLGYVEDGFYDGTVFHRVIPGFVVQGGGFAADAEKKPTGPPIALETSGLANTRGSIAMARTQNPDSATSQFYINLADNAMLDPSPQRPGYTVFGRVIRGMDVIDAIAAHPTGTRAGMTDWPEQEIIIERAYIR